MAFERMGMQGAQPLFQVDNVMVGGRDLCRYEVAPDVVGVKAARKSGSGVYREDITEFDHDDARLIAAAPDLLAALRAAYAEIDRLQSQLIAVQEDAMTIYGDNDRLTAEIDRLRANALEWVTVTEDPATLPEEYRNIIVKMRKGRGDGHTAAFRDGDQWAVTQHQKRGGLETCSMFSVSPGDRWAYIPEVPDANN